MENFDRLPALPLIANDPYFSVWLPADLPTQANTIHWTGAPKWIRGHITIDNMEYRWLGKNATRAMKTTEVRVTPTKTRFVLEAASVELTVEFISPLLTDDLDIMSTPITFVEFSAKSIDGAKHRADLQFLVPHSLCYDGASRPDIRSDSFVSNDLNIAYAGQVNQKVLCHSGDMITIDWGYLYVASHLPVKISDEWIECNWSFDVEKEKQQAFVMVGYDDIASINYFGSLCRSWYARNGKTLPEALHEFNLSHDDIISRCLSLDENLLDQARAIGGSDYELIISAAWRHTIAAHKLIASPEEKPVFLSKENNSNGCIGTVDLIYPSSPLFLKFCPDLINAMCLPVLQFANMPVWEFDFSPHDIGRYPYATGEVYSLPCHLPCGHVYPPYYLYAPGSNIYTTHRAMPVEECGNMLIVLYAAIYFGADDALVREYLPTLEKWVHYLDEYGEDPGEQLCTDDFAGHLSHNVNLSAKAIMGVACYGKLLEHLGDIENGRRWLARANDMAQNWMDRVGCAEYTPLTFDGIGWSMKYNLVWDLVFHLDLFPKDFYDRETKSYLSRMNDFGLPLDSRADYTKSDWIAWCAAMAQDKNTRNSLLGPIAFYLRNTKTRVPFSDWYDTLSGDFVEFIARSVQGGLFMPMLTSSRCE